MHKNYTKIVFKLYYFNEKRLLVVFLVAARFLSLLSQDLQISPDTAHFIPELTSSDTLVIKRKDTSAEAIDKQVVYSSEGYKKNDLVNKKAILTGNATVTYGNIKINADSIVFNMAANTVFAAGRRDSTGKVIGAPVFSEGSQEFESDSLIYNFKSRKALAYNIVTMQEDGLVRSKVTKLLEDGSSNISRSTYSTCDAETPHFYINLPKAKVYPGKKIISGPGNLVLEGIPLPIALPFGFFPIQTKRAASGILIPKVGQEQQRGYSLTEGGYYFALNDYFDLALKGNIYTNGTWMLNATTNYNKLYKYSGNFSFSYANNISGHKGLPDYRSATNYKIGWTYNQNPKAHPGSRFSASVNMSSSGFDKTNSYDVSEHITTQRQSSVSYSKTWDGTPFNLSASMNHSQNVKNKTVSVNLPKVNFNVGRIYPLKSRRSPGSKKWYKELQFQYTASLDNQINTYDSLLFKKQTLNGMRSGFKHDAPLSLQIRPFRNFSISPTMSYSGVLYTQKIEKKWNPEYINPVTGEPIPSLVNDTLRGFFYGHSLKPSVSANFSPQVFGMFTFKPESRVQAIRHVMKPSVGFNYIPSIKGLSSDMYRQVQSDTTGRITEYSIYDGNIYGTPSLSRRSSGITFSLVNILEGKVFQKNDTTGEAKKVKIIDNFGINTSYNVFADSMRWSPVSMAMRTTVFENFNISANSSFSLYGLSSNGRPINTFSYALNRKLMRLTNFSVSLDFELSKLFKKEGRDSRQASSQQMTPGSRSPGSIQEPGMSRSSIHQGDDLLFDEYGYYVFDVPWSMNVRYNLNYSKPAFKSMLTQTLSVNGNVTLTKKMAITYTSGYDFRMKEITMTQIGITRDLHCWEMNFNWVPNGTMKMWNFTIRVKASILSDLKYERRKDFHDQYY